MIKLEILKTGISLYKSGNIIEKELFRDINEIFFKIYGMLSKFEKIENIEIIFDDILFFEFEGEKVQMESYSISKDFYEGIVELVEEKGGDIDSFRFELENISIDFYREKKQKIKKSRKVIYLCGIGGILALEIFLYMFFKRSSDEIKLKKDTTRMEISSINKEILEKRERILILEKEIEEYKNNLNEEEEKIEIYKFLENLKSSFTSQVKIKTIKFLEKNIIKIEGYSKEMLEIYRTEEYLNKNNEFKNIKIDYIKEKGGGFEYGIELESS